MFKHFLSYSFALGFHQDCQSLSDDVIAPKLKARAVQSSAQLLLSFERALRTSDPKEEARFLYSAIVNSRDARDELTAAGVFEGDLKARWEVVHARLEKLCVAAADRGERGQLRMLG